MWRRTPKTCPHQLRIEGMILMLMVAQTNKPEHDDLFQRMKNFVEAEQHESDVYHRTGGICRQ